MATKGWISKWAMLPGALEASTEGRLVMDDGYLRPSHTQSSGLLVITDIGAPSVEAGSLNDVLPAAKLPAAATDEIHAASTLSNGATLTVNAAITNPDVPRTIAFLGNAAGIAGNVVVTGTDVADAAATDTIALSGTTKVYGTTNFKTVTSYILPARTTAGDTVCCGLGRDIGAGITAPDMARSLGIKGSQAGVAGDVVITGTDYNGAVISETIVAVDDTKVYGLYAFKTVTNIRLPALVGAGDTMVVGRAPKLGLSQLLSSANQVVLGLLGRVVTAPTITVSATVLGLNTVDMAVGTYNATKRAVVIFYL